MNGFRVYIEGGGDGRGQKATLRTGFQEFLKPLRDAARARNLRWNVVMCGSRESAFKDYRTALKTHPESVNLLLVDAEGPVSSPPWKHLARKDGWKNPGVTDDHCHLMVQMVEAWILADPEALSAYYGNGFRAGGLPKNPDVEAIPKASLLKALESATAPTKKGQYAKIRHCADLLARISTAKVRKRAKHCEQLFVTVQRMVDGISS